MNIVLDLTEREQEIFDEVLEKIEERRMRWLDDITDLKDMSLRNWW